MRLKPIALLTAVALLGCDESPAPNADPAVAPPPQPSQAQPSQATTAEGAGAPSAKPDASSDGGALYIDPGAEPPVAIDRAVAVVDGLGDSDASGTVRFEERDGKLHVTTTMKGLPPGEHAYHVHLLGDCSSADGKSAGTHFNFDGPSKNPPKDVGRITGNLGVLEVGDDGEVEHEATIEKASLHGKFSIIGRAIIVHEKGNDPDQPPIGAAGGRLACGVIGRTEKDG